MAKPCRNKLRLILGFISISLTVGTRKGQFKNLFIVLLKKKLAHISGTEPRKRALDKLWRVVRLIIGHNLKAVLNAASVKELRKRLIFPALRILKGLKFDRR